MNKFCVEIAKYQVCKYTEKTFGDCFVSIKNPEDGRLIAVLSDGLGSGVKANVLSTLTATMAAKCVSEHLSPAETAQIITKTLPVCSRRHVSYSTFTIADVSRENEVRIIEYDNPPTLIIRDKKLLDLQRQTTDFSHARSTQGVGIKTNLQELTFQAQSGDRILFFSDGIVQSGMGSKKTPLGWGIRAVKQFVLDLVETAPNCSARDLAKTLVKKAVSFDDHLPKDDITCAVVYFRQPRSLLLVSGPPFREESDVQMAQRVRDFEGKKIICGGTTTNILARELGLTAESCFRTADSTIPPISRMAGIDLVTEGVITLTRVATLLESCSDFDRIPPHAAQQMIELLMNADRIEFLVGTKLNQMHHDPSIPVELELRRSLIRRIARTLEVKFLKQVEIKYI